MLDIMRIMEKRKCPALRKREFRVQQDIFLHIHHFGGDSPNQKHGALSGGQHYVVSREKMPKHS